MPPKPLRTPLVRDSARLYRDLPPSQRAAGEVRRFRRDERRPSFLWMLCEECKCSICNDSTINLVSAANSLFLGL